MDINLIDIIFLYLFSQFLLLIYTQINLIQSISFIIFY